MNLRSDEEASKRARTEEAAAELPAFGSGSTGADDQLQDEDQAEAVQAEESDH